MPFLSVLLLAVRPRETASPPAAHDAVEGFVRTLRRLAERGGKQPAIKHKEPAR